MYSHDLAGKSRNVLQMTRNATTMRKPHGRNMYIQAAKVFGSEVCQASLVVSSSVAAIAGWRRRAHLAVLAPLPQKLYRRVVRPQLGAELVVEAIAANVGVESWLGGRGALGRRRGAQLARVPIVLIVMVSNSS